VSPPEIPKVLYISGIPVVDPGEMAEKIVLGYVLRICLRRRKIPKPLPRPFFRPRSIIECQQRPNPSLDTLPLK
jgi:hypothetical protein